MNDLTIVPNDRGLEDVTKDIHYQTGNFLRTAIEIGRLLFEAKTMVEPGGWGKYIDEKLPFSHRWANNYMQLYKAYGSDQVSLFGDSQVFMNLRPTQALELLALPSEDREQFVQTHDMENMSTRDLHKEVQEELEKTRAALRDAEQDKLVLQNKVAAMESTEEAWEAEIQKYQDKADAAKAAKEDIQKKLDEMTAKAKTAEESAKDSEKKLADLKRNPKIPESVMEELQQRFTAEADKKAAEAAQKELDKLSQELKKAEAARVAAEQELAAAKKQNQLSDPDAAVFKTIFQQVQEDFNRLTGVLIKIEGKDPALGQKLHVAVNALLDKLKEGV